jgi:hypothetical protein
MPASVLAQTVRAIFPAFAISFALAAFSSAASASHAGDGVEIGSFSHGTMTGWESRAFEGETRYALVTDPELRTTVLAAAADQSASGRFRKIQVNLTKTPMLNWSWKVTNVLSGTDELKKSGDDFPARLYVVVERGPFGISSLSLNYVWSSHQAVGRRWNSPYSDQVVLLAADSGSEKLGSWVRHRRDLRADLRSAFGEDIAAIDAVAVMTDTDNSGGAAKAFYGDIWFSAR